MLLIMVIPTEADRPFIGRLESDATVRIAPNMRAFDRPQKTAGDAAMMLAHPRAVSGTLPAVPITSFLALKPFR
jgi:hypothetical protein